MTDVENAGMEVQERRLRFLTLHLHDLFSLRGAPLWLMLMPLKERVSPWVDQIGYCLGMIVELRWSRFLSNFIERRYGKTTLTREERRRQAFPHRIVALATLACPCAWLVCRVWYGRGTAMEVGLYSLVLLIFLRKISDGTNPALRRSVYGAGFIIVAVGLPLLVGFRNGGPLAVALLGGVFFLLGVFDYLLLVRTAGPVEVSSVAEGAHA